MALIDTHCHIDFEQYDGDRDAVMARAAAAGVTRVINPATDFDSGAAALRLADKYVGLYVAVGIHPNSTAAYQASDLDVIQEQAQHAKTVAIGEIGLDYYRDWSPKQKQRAAFERGAKWRGVNHC